ncbi:(E3-independent) E2 ubiquitin-conjugating enzyme [Frankliniella fusca]|uniref:(E3-independent) E2 ubiquitin-conjugating enzyme n=1 Tax=Frankliniella fusca TaxID=407009 RepID=A0AAE1HZ05_9NEOP|nr:(E3-independent) E2 ubiquitin-conjugating enzyme [Frankliniella fusca]
MAAVEDQYFYEDEVYRIDKRGQIEFGMVLENSELVSSDENSEAEDGPGMKKGQIRVAWHPSGVEEVISEKKVGLADRSLMPGDVVRRMIKGKDTQRGYCRDISVTACVQVVGTKQVIPNVKSEHLVPLEEFAEDIAVCLDSWVGGIKMVHSKLHLYLPDAGPGSRCVINELEANGLDEFDEKKDPLSEFPHRSDYYPGQVLYGPLHCLEYANWTQCTKDMKAQRSKPNKVVQVVVEGVETTSVGVHWQCRAYSKDGAGNDKEQPKFLVQGEDLKRLKLLNVFEPCTLQVGDRNYYTFREEDTVITKEHWKRNQREIFRPTPKERDCGTDNQHQRRRLSQKQVRVYGPSTKQAATEPKTNIRPMKTCQDIDIMSCQDSKASDSGVARNKDPASEQTRKKRTAGESKLTYSRQKLQEASMKAGSHSSKRLATGEHRVEDSSIANKNDGVSQEPATEDHTSEASGNKGYSVAKTRTINASHQLGSEEVVHDHEDDYSTSEETSISSGCSSTGSLGLRKKGPALMTKVLKKKKLRRAKKRAPQVTLEPGTRVVVETLSTSSVADVIWQDGSVERGIPSTQLYPIHHLDDQEFFPGDFVIENKDENSCMRVYGVIQMVDHAGRTAKVKWFKTYTSNEEPQPTLLEENEVSVYDLKDHPDFQYRPGTVVIRVANFEGEDVNCTAGQVLDNYPEGRVRVWWVDGHISMCWPQDLYKCGEYDSEDGELWEETNSEASWETESEDTVAGEGEIEPEYESLRPKLAANIEKARIAMSRLEEIFTQNPALQNTDVMRRLLEVYKDCRYLDKLMNTSFFHEKHFEGLLEKVRERGRVNVAQRVADQVSRLFHPNTSSTPLSDPDAEAFPELAVTLQLAEQINELVQSQLSSAAQIPPKNSNNFLDKLYEHHHSLKKVSQHIRQLFQNSLCPRNTSQDKDACNNEKQDGPSSHETFRVLGEAKFNACDFGGSDSSKTYTLRLIFIHPDDNTSAPVKSANGGGNSSPLCSSPATQDSLKTDEELDLERDVSDHPIQLDESDRNRQSLPEKITSGEFLAESLSSLERRVSVAAAAAVAPGSTRRLARKMSVILSKFGGSVRCELLAGDEVVYSKDLGSPRARSNTCPSAQPSPNKISSSDSTRDESCSAIQASEEMALASSSDAEDPADNANSNNAVCVRLCSLIKAQLVKAHAEVTRRYGGQQLPMTLSDAANSVSPGSNPGEVVENDTTIVPSVPNIPVSEILEDAVTSDLNTSTQSADSENLPDARSAPSILTAESDSGSFAIEDNAPISHKFKLTMFQPVDHQNFYRTVRKEIKLLRSALPSGIWVKGFEDRMDLYSVMIRGPEKTPYEDGLFLFDFQLSPNYPNEPPLCHYISYCSDRLNPNLYEDGKVCVSLLGTWSGKGTELWSSKSNLLQVIVSIQGLILVNEPYFNEAGYEKQKGSQQGRENSRMYNEMVLLKLVQAMSKLVQNPPPAFEEDIREHFKHHAPRFASRLNKWLEVSDHYNNLHPVSPSTPTSFKEIAGDDLPLPEFPLIPASKGFCLTLKKTLSCFKEVMSSLGIIPPESSEESQPEVQSDATTSS